MPPRRTLDAFLDQGEQRGGQDEQGIINDDEVRKALQPGTERNYDRSVALWDTYARRMPGANLDNFETPKDFMRKIAHAIDGRYGDPKACLTTVVQYWKNLTAGWRRTDRPKIRDDVVLSTSNFIKGPLQKEMNLARQKRARRYGTMLHFVYLGTQLWKYDWHLYDNPRDRLELWDGIMLNVFTSARVGEYIESTAREGSGRGLHYKASLLRCRRQPETHAPDCDQDVEFVVFRNEHGNPEFAMEVKKDGKGMTATPWRNPEHALHEGSGLHPLLCNPMLTRIAILLAKGAFRDFKTVDELLNVEPPKEGIVRIEWHPDFRDQPVYERDDGHIWSARTYCSRLSAAGIRAGFPSLQNHDFRAEVIRAIDKKYSSSQRRRHAGHGSDDVYDKYYAPTNPGTDGQGAYAGDPLRTLLPKLLRFLKMNHNPTLAQTLPARELHELITSDEYSAIANELEGLADCDDESSKKRRADLLASLRKLKLSALQRYRDQQASNPFRTTNTDDVRHYRTPFSRIRHLMPIRDRLSESMFTVAPIRSEVGRAVLEDLIALYQSKVEVQHRPGLEPEKCHCPTHPDENKYVLTHSPIFQRRFADLWKCE
ncbi:uncharacterized protein C8Q71DRAFT_701269 [Rhodofomes roseus]|uniref:Uncharacterized protein n=1 Tax=Rhodofomes roseus TaxID=34475 RepID=A0ABQ8KQV9_9APHY|nr:uncharacterized protein C8Q71DRAFT_701269 [Rhodofomes roseus]KAH9841009.1 hypothetical protein C8Q71DRAFT_701269 [Rhodofomes roseus]